MGANNVLNIIQYRHSNHRELATLPVDLRPVAHGLVQVEPSACQRWAVQHQAIDIDQSPTPCPSDLRDEVREFWMFLFFDQGYARHKICSRTFRIDFIMIASREDSLKNQFGDFDAARTSRRLSMYNEKFWLWIKTLWRLLTLLRFSTRLRIGLRRFV